MKDRCFMVPRKPPAGGGNVHFANSGHSTRLRPMIVRRTAAIGDALCATVVADRLYQMGYEVVFQTHNMIHCVIRRHPRLYSVEEPSGAVDVNLDGAYEKDPRKAYKHFHQMFFERANQQLYGRGIQIGNPTNCRPRLVVAKSVKDRIQETFLAYPRPWVLICPRSNSYTVRQVPDQIWATVATQIRGTCIWLGTHPAPPGIIDLHAKHFDNVIEWISVADMLLTVDTGPMHVAAALGIPIIAIGQSSNPELHLSDQNDYQAIYPDLDCLGCMQNLCPKNKNLPPCQNISPAVISRAVNRRLDKSDKSVSCVIPTHKAPADRLNRCINAVLGQVDEVIVSRAADGTFPAGRINNDRVRYVRHRSGHLGFGKNVNFGVRNTRNQWILILNDDCYLEEHAVDRMLEVTQDPQVGMVGHLLRYPDGKICHGGKYRDPGMRGWGLTDNRKWEPTIREPREMENVTGTSFIVRRDVFYQVGGFDEDFFMYAEDDAFCCQVRQAGWKIIYTPHAMGIHDEAMTSRLFGDMLNWVRQGNATFDRKWGWYLQKNMNQIPGVFT